MKGVKILFIVVMGLLAIMITYIAIGNQDYFVTGETADRQLEYISKNTSLLQTAFPRVNLLINIRLNELIIIVGILAILTGRRISKIMVLVTSLTLILILIYTNGLIPTITNLSILYSKKYGFGSELYYLILALLGADITAIILDLWGRRD